MRIELDSLRPDWRRQVKRAAGFQQSMKAIQAFDMALEIDWIAIASKAKVLDGMQTGKGIGVAKHSRRRRHQVRLFEQNVAYLGIHWTDIQHLDGPKSGYVRYETVYARANIDMSFWAALEDAPRYEQVLMKVVSLGCAALLLLFMGIRIELGKVKFVR